MQHSHLIGQEHRLIYRTLSDFGQVAPVNARAAQEAAKLQNANAKTKGISVGDNPNADLVERMVQVNFDMSKATPQEIARHEEGLRLADGNNLVAAPGNNPAKGVMTNQEKTYANQAAGLNTTFTSETGRSIYDQPGTYTASSDSGLEQSAIDHMRKLGMSDEQIRQNLSDPARMESIRTTMSNTGLGGTARQSAVLTPAQAQNILATSRNPKQRAEAQKFIDDQVSGVKGYTPRTETDENGVTRTTYSQDEQATEMARQRERERLALEESNRLKSQENADKLKKFTAGIDTTQLDQTKTQIDGLLASIQNLSPDLQAAVLPSLISLQNSNNEITKQVNDMIAAQPSDADIEEQYGSVEEYIKSEDQKYKDLIAKNFETSKEIATYNRDMLEIDKKIMDHDAAVAEQKQLAANVDGEKKLRRQLNRLGIQTDVSGLTYLQTEIQKGVDALENLKTANNLVSLKAQLAIGEGYRLEVKQAMETYEGNYLNITSQTTERLQAIKNSISTAKADRTAAIIEAKKWGLEQKQQNDAETRTTISGAYVKMIEMKGEQKTQEIQAEANALDQIEYLSANFAPEDVADQIRALAKNVTSFDASTLAGKAPLDVQEQLKKLRKGSGGGLYIPGSGPSIPTQTFDEYVKGQIEAKEAELGMSMNQQARDEFVAANKANFMVQYQGSSSGSAGSAPSSGDPAVDEVAQLVVSGVYANAKEASNETGIPSIAIARQVGVLQNNGVGGGAVSMSPKQQTNFLRVVQTLNADPTTQFARAVPYKVAAVTVGLSKKNGAADIVAINSFQNGLVDPGAVTRSEDVTLLTERAAPILAKYSTDYWKNRFAQGGLIPEVERQQLIDIANELERASITAYQQGPYANLVNTGRALGLPEQNLKLYQNVTNDVINEDPLPVTTYTSQFGYE